MIICHRCLSQINNHNFQCPKCGYTPEKKQRYTEWVLEAKSNDGFDSKYYQYLFEAEKNYFWFLYRNKLIQFFFNKHFPVAEKFCEIGCGTGLVLSSLAANRPGIQYTGSDINKNALFFASKRAPQARLILADIYHFTFTHEFDVIGAFDVLEHTDDDILALKNIYRSIKSGGGVIITVPQYQWLWSMQDEAACHKRRYSKADLKTKIENTGFQIERLTSFVSLLMPLIIITRFKNRFSSAHFFDATSELKIPIALNSLFYKLCLSELLLIKYGADLPTGGSLVCVARKQ